MSQVQMATAVERAGEACCRRRIVLCLGNLSQFVLKRLSRIEQDRIQQLIFKKNRNMGVASWVPFQSPQDDSHAMNIIESKGTHIPAKAAFPAKSCGSMPIAVLQSIVKKFDAAKTQPFSFIFTHF